MEEFALCWKNFQDNIADGFHGLFVRGDLVDVTLACGDGRLLQAHKTVLAICSPYFQEMFLTNPCKHPIIILKDVTYDVMTALLQFMYQGVVNVKHDELPFFMKIAASLQIKGLTAHEEQHRHNHSNNANTPGMTGMHPKYSGHNSAHKDSQTPTSTGSGGSATKRSQDLHHESFSIMSKQRRTHQPPQQRLMAELLHQVQLNHHQQQNRSTEGDLSSNSEEGGVLQHNSNMTTDHDALMPAISLTESPFQLGHPQVKQESVDQASSPSVNNGSGSNNSTAGQNHNNGSMDKPLYNSAMKLEFGSSDLQAAAAAAAAVCYPLCSNRSGLSTSSSPLVHSNEMLNMSQELFSRSANHMEIPTVTPGEKWHHGKLEFMLSQRGKPLLVHDSHTFGIQYIRKDKKYWQCNLSRKYNCKARVTTTEGGDIIVTNNEHCHTEIRQHLRKEYKLNRLHNMSQSLLQQHALQLNLNRLSAAAAQRQTQQQQQAAIGSPMLLPTTQDQQMAKSLAQASLKLENNNNNTNDQDNNTHKNGDQPEMGRHEKESLQGAGDEELSKRDWKEEIFRNASMREDIK